VDLRRQLRKKILLLLLVVIFFYGCARPLTSHKENVLPPPSAEAIWVYGHYDSQGRWIPGRWVE
jgi:hypothetical protein